jgi:hypothetical protein
MTVKEPIVLFLLLAGVVVFGQPSPKIDGKPLFVLAVIALLYGAWIVIILALLAAILRVLGHL